MPLPERAAGEMDGLVADWIRKADLDFNTVVRLAPEDAFRDVVVFHSQQAVGKYLKALLTKRQLEFPGTHEIRRLLELLNASDPKVVEALRDATWLDPFGSEWPARDPARRRVESMVNGKRPKWNW